jgi:hypothetical protein
MKRHCMLWLADSERSKDDSKTCSKLCSQRFRSALSLPPQKRNGERLRECPKTCAWRLAWWRRKNCLIQAWLRGIREENVLVCPSFQATGKQKALDTLSTESLLTYWVFIIVQKSIEKRWENTMLQPRSCLRGDFSWFLWLLSALRGWHKNDPSETTTK